MKILFYGAKDYDQQFFDKLKPAARVQPVFCMLSALRRF